MTVENLHSQSILDVAVKSWPDLVPAKRQPSLGTSPICWPARFSWPPQVKQWDIDDFLLKNRGSDPSDL